NTEPLHMETFVIGDLAREAIEQVEDRLAGKHLHNSITEDWQGTIRADRFKLAQVFDNLLDNAVKFTPEEGEIRIEIEIDPTAPDHIRVTISNPGEGIPAEALPRLFLRYFQGPSGQQRSGYGLGLAICKQNVELHGGSIEVDSVPHERTSFRFTLPFGEL